VASENTCSAASAVASEGTSSLSSMASEPNYSLFRALGEKRLSATALSTYLLYSG